MHILAVATQGTGGNDEARLRALTHEFQPEFFPFDRAARFKSFRRLLGAIWRRRPALVILEGTGLAGGLAVLAGRACAGVPYIVSSGDAVGPFVAMQYPWLGLLFGIYERLLCRCSAGYIGWTPYLTGRALTFGAPRAMTAPGWAPFQRSKEELLAGRERVRRQLGIAANALVVGIVGSLAWNRRVSYCYGMELVRAVTRLTRTDVRVLIVGDGNGRAHLEKAAGSSLGQGVLLTGKVEREQVPDYLAALDVASLPQSLDQVGSFRYTTKLSEYLAAGLPVITGQLPLAYDLDGAWLWRLPGRSPWDERYIAALAGWLDGLTPAELATRRDAVPQHPPEFERGRQVDRVREFIRDVLEK